MMPSIILAQKKIGKKNYLVKKNHSTSDLYRGNCVFFSDFPKEKN